MITGVISLNMTYQSASATGNPTASTPVATAQTSCVPNEIVNNTVFGGEAKFTIPADGCAAKISFSSYKLPGGFVTPFEAQVLHDNKTATYGPGTYTVKIGLPTCAWQSDLYFGDVQMSLKKDVGHTNLVPGLKNQAWDFVEGVVCNTTTTVASTTTTTRPATTTTVPVTVQTTTTTRPATTTTVPVTVQTTTTTRPATTTTVPVTVQTTTTTRPATTTTVPVTVQTTTTTRPATTTTNVTVTTLGTTSTTKKVAVGGETLAKTGYTGGSFMVAAGMSMSAGLSMMCAMRLVERRRMTRFGL
jgi:hypothetical protein